MKLIFTNAFGNRGNVEKKEIDIKSKCVITNYNPSTHSPEGAGDLTVTVDENETTIKKGKSVFVQGNTVDFNETKYSIFNRLALQDNDSSNLTEQDLELASKKFRQGCKLWELGVLSIEYNKNTGKAVIKIKDNQVLYIDFETEKEKPSATKAEAGTEKTSTTRSTTATTTSAASTANTENSNVVSKVISKFKGGNIDISDVHDMSTVAKYTGISESYIKDVLVGIEGKKNLPVLTAEYDNVPNKSHPNGYLTIGFGHTSLIGEPNVAENMVITEKQAYQILANDIMSSIVMAKRKLGSLYTDAPKSVQDAIVDIVFNKGPNAINNSLKANLQNGYYHSAALRTWYDTENRGLQKRNIYRFIAAISSLSHNDKDSAVNRFKNLHLYEMAAVFKIDNDAKIAWNRMCDNNNLKDYRA